MQLDCAQIALTALRESLLKIKENIKILGHIHSILGSDVEIDSSLYAPGSVVAKMMSLGVCNGAALMDFGCGRAAHRDLLQRSGLKWIGVDYFESGSVHFVHDRPDGVIGYDGKVIPLESNSIDAVWSWQALEHVHEPEQSISEIHRVMKENGIFAGSTSFLEPFHGRSTFSYTPYGFQLLLKRHGLKLINIAPGPDGLSMILRYLTLVLGLEPDEGILNDRFLMKLLLELSPKSVTRRKIDEIQLQLCGHFRFIAKKLSVNT